MLFLYNKLHAYLSSKFFAVAWLAETEQVLPCGIGSHDEAFLHLEIESQSHVS